MEDQEVDRIIKENERRKEIINSPHNPRTGEGCVSIARSHLHVSDMPFQNLWLPVEMWEKENVVKDLQNAGSIKNLFESRGVSFTQDRYYNFVLTFCEIRERYDFEFFSVSRIKITSKLTGTLVPFILNRGQRRLLATLEDMRLRRVPIRVILLKARQWGGSTLVQIYFLWIQTILVKGYNSSICAHVQDASRNILRMFKTAMDNYPVVEGRTRVELIPCMGMQNAREITGRECSITVGSAVKPESIRSQSVHLAHFSEVGLYPTTENNSPESLIASVSSIIPNVPLSAIVYESTAKGVGNFFHTQWIRAVQGKTRFTAVFIEWFLIDIYSEPIEMDIREFIKGLNDYELGLIELGATLEAINWYRLKKSEIDDEDTMMQEFPSTAIEAFRFSGTMAFDRIKLEKLREGCCEPPIRGELISKSATISETRLRPEKIPLLFQDLFVSRQKHGAFKVWVNPDRSEKVSNRYVVVVDAGGRSSKSDYSCICVFDRYWMMYGEAPEVVAEWHGHTDLDILAWNAAQIAHWYCDALLVFESNTYEKKQSEVFNIDGDNSEYIFSIISKYYNNLYSRTPADKVAEGIPPKYGFHTNKSTKPMIVSNFVATLRENGYVERETEAINEGLIYEKKKDGSFGNVKGTGNHDDRIMTRMIGCFICYDLPIPKVVNRDTEVLQRFISSEASI